MLVEQEPKVSSVHDCASLFSSKDARRSETFRTDNHHTHSNSAFVLKEPLRQPAVNG